MEDTPTFKANQYANKAEEYARKGDYNNACTSHFRAAELFLLAMNDTKDAEAVKTLKLLYASHTRSGKELQRRLATSSTRPAQVGLTTHQPQQSVSQNINFGKPTSSAPSAPTSSISGGSSGRKAIQITSAAIRSVETGPSQSMMVGSTELFMGQNSGSNSNIPNDLESMLNEDVYGRHGTPSHQYQDPSSSSIAQSYMILDTNTKELKAASNEEHDDPFNKFWDAVEVLVHKISGPAVAFSSTPISDVDAPFAGKQIDSAQNSIGNSYLFIKPGDMDESHLVSSRGVGFHSMVRQSGMLDRTKSANDLELENSQLKQTIDLMSKRIVELERAQQENAMLKSSIIQFREDVQRQRAMHSSIPSSVPGRAPSGNVPGLSISQGSAASTEVQQLQQTILKLEHELSKAHETILAQQKKWDKLKESVKKKREGKGSISSQSDSISIFTDNLQPEVVASAHPSSSSAAPPTVLSPSNSSMYFSMAKSNFSQRD